MATSLGRKLAAVCGIESTYGTAPSFNQATDSILLYENVNPVAVDTRMVDIVPIRETFTKVKSIVGRQLYRFSGVTFLQGAETLASDLPWRCGVLLRACGLQQTINTASSIVYAPRSSSFESAAMTVWLDGYKHPMTGMYGTFVMEGRAGEGVRVTLDMLGLYTAPTVEAIPTQTLETAKAPAWESAAGWIAGQTVVIKSFRLTAGVVVSERPDANAANALAGLMITDRNPTLDMTVEVNTALRNYFSDLDAATTQAVSFQVGTASGNRVVFQAPTAQLTAMPYAEDAGLRVFNLTWKLQHATAETEFNFTFN